LEDHQDNLNMFRIMFATALLACLALRASALPTISVKGAKFFAGGNQFFLKGMETTLFLRF
jgi:hypothetical protein